MATSRLTKRLSALKKSRKARLLSRQERSPRLMHLEPLEDRRVMALGPSLVAVIPNSGVFLNTNDTLNVAPKEITFRFAQGNTIAPATIAGGFQVVRGGADQALGTADDVVVTPGFIGLAATPREVIMRFAQNLPDDIYRVTLIGAGATPLKDAAGNPFNMGVDQQVNFRLDLGQKVRSVVPQPITRDPVTRVLSQDRRAIEVYFDQNQFAPAVVQTPGFYRLINTATGAISIPNDPATPVVYDPVLRKATLKFQNDIPAGTFRLEVGVTHESDDRTSLARHIANSMASPLQGFIGDNVALAAATQANDVDLYRFDLRAAAPISVTATPGASLDAVIRIFDASGVPVGAVVNGGAAGVAESVTTAVLPAGTYFVGISSAANTAYNVVAGTGAAGGTTTGSYSLQVTFNDLGAFSDANSSFATATPLGVIGLAGRTLAAAIQPQNYSLPGIPAADTNIQFPGAGDAPGERDIPYEAHILTIPGLLPDATTGVREITYDFQNIYGFTPQGESLFNAITEPQKQRAREALELWSRYLGVQFREVHDPNGVIPVDWTIATGVPGAVAPTIVTGDPNTNNGVFGIAGKPDIPTLANPVVAATLSPQVAIVNSATNWGNSQYGGQYFIQIMHQLGHLLGLGENFEAPDLTIMGGGEVPDLATNTGEPVFPGDADIVYGQAVHRPESRDIDLYQFSVTTAGVFRAETVAERLANSSLLNTVLTLYKEPSVAGQPRQIVARDDDYYGNDSYLELRLDPGTYYVAVTSTGNVEFDPTIADSGFGGRTQGNYELKMDFKADGGTSLADSTGVKFDGDADGTPGGQYQFWFQGNTAANTIYVDKTPPASPSGTAGSLTNPFTNLATALSAATPGQIVRIVGNGGTDGNVNTLGDNAPYLVGFRDPALTQPLADGGEFLVPQDVTVMIDAGAVFKLRRANLNAGTTPQGILSRAGSAIQVLGTPTSPVQFTSFADDTIGGDSDGPSLGPQGGDYGGIVFRDDSDREHRIPDVVGNLTDSNPYVFLNYVNHATMTYGGGKVFVDSVEEVYTPIHMVTARPALSYNIIQQSADAALSADPNSFYDDGLRPAIAFDNRHLGPDIHDNTVLNNSVNGLFIRVRTLAGNPLDFVDLTTRWNDTDIVHVVSENVHISGTPGGSSTPGSDRAPTTLTDARLRVDPGMIVKLSGARIEARISSQFIAEGTVERPIIFTSLKDDKYGAGGTFDTNRDLAASLPGPGQWGGLIFDAASSGSIAQARVFYGGGQIPIEGGFDRFNTIEIHQADVRIANTLLQFNDLGTSTTDRNGRGTNADATIFVRGAQPIIVNNIIRDNAGPVISVNANALLATGQHDFGRSTGPADLFTQFNGNVGPLVRGNKMVNNQINGMEVRGGTLTTETIWDDTDIAHILRSEIVVPNHQVFSGIRLQSSASESLVVKLAGATAGITADGRLLDIADRIGGTVQVIGQAGHPVILTSLADDTVPAGFQPSDPPVPLFDTNSNGPSTGTAGAWRGLRLDKLSNDRNVATVLEAESAFIGNNDHNRIPQNAQLIGSLAPSQVGGDDNRRLGFQVQGTIAYDRPSDVDVYSFNADSGSEIWIDIDRTQFTLDAMVELVDANGNVLASSTDTSLAAPLNSPPNPIIGLNPNASPTVINPVNGQVGLAQTFNKDFFNGRDTYSTNPHDPIMRVVLPKAANGSNLVNVPWFVRVRSQPTSFTGESGNTLNAGLTSGSYQLQVRLQQKDEKPGSTVKFADIRFATNAIEVLGLPYHSPLAGETVEANDGTNNTQGGAQLIGNLLQVDRNTLSVGGSLSSLGDVDWYRFDVNFDLIQVINGYTSNVKSWATIFDLDYADGLSRADATISVFDQAGRLILVGRDSNVEDDQPGVNQGGTASDLSRGTFGKLDPYIGSVQLPAGIVGGLQRTYFVAVSSNRNLPQVLNQTFNAAATASGVRLEPIDSVARMSNDHFDVTNGETANLPEGTFLDPVTGLQRSLLIDDTNTVTLSANVRPFALTDVSLYVSQANRIRTVDPAFSSTNPNRMGGQEVDVGANASARLRDLNMRGDATLWGLEDLLNVQNTVGRLVQMADTGTAAVTVIGNDNIPNFDPATNPPDPNQITSDNADALAWGGSPTNNPQQTLFYAIPDPVAGASRLYRADPANGSAAVVQGQPWGRIGGTNVMTAASRASASTNFNLGGVVTLNVQADTVGPTENNTTINFTRAALGPGVPPTVTLIPGTPATINVVLNSSNRAATGSIAFNGGLANLQFTAVQPGAAGNNIRVVFTTADLNGLPPQVSVAGSTINVTLSNNVGNPTTTASLIQAIQGDAQANALITATFISGNINAAITSTATVALTAGADATTAAQLANQLNLVAGSVIDATVSGNGNTPIGQQNPAGPPPFTPLVLLGGAGTAGFVRGMSFGANNQLYGVTNEGQFLVNINTGTATPQQVIDISLPGALTPNFQGLARGPRNVENGRYANMMFAITDNGLLCAISIAAGSVGVPQTIFDTNNDGIADSTVINVGLTGLTGLAFSNFDFNLWHPTHLRGNNPGHDLGLSPTEVTHRVNVVPNFNQSYYFGYEQRTTTESLSYVRFPAFGPNPAHAGQLGILADITQQELSLNGALNNTYNLPGGAYGSLITDAFSLETLHANDKPTFYFDYFLDTEDDNTVQNGLMRDSARVYVGVPLPGGGTRWDMLATNNSTLDNPVTGAAASGFPVFEGELPTFLSASATAMPDNPHQQIQLLHDDTGAWRQARVDLSRYAGLSGLQLRFDFSTAGDSTRTSLANNSDFNNLLREDSWGNFNGTGRLLDNQHEGWYIDNIIVGPAERGEMVINAPVNTNFFQTPTPLDYDRTLPVATETLTGPYQLEIRRGAEYGESDGRVIDGLNVTGIRLTDTFDTNERLIPEKRVTFDDFSTGDFSARSVGRPRQRRLDGRGQSGTGHGQLRSVQRRQRSHREQPKVQPGGAPGD